MWCTQCGVQLEENANFCHSCGAPCEQEITEETEDLNRAGFQEETVGDCPNCGATQFSDDAFCNQCGSPVSQLHTEAVGNRCLKCNTEYQPGDQFCSECGTQLGQRATSAPYILNPYVWNSLIFNGLKQVPGFIRSYFRQPIATTITVVGEPSPFLPVILFIIYVIAYGIQLFLMLQSLCDVFQNLVRNMFGMFAATFLMEAPLWTSLVFGVLYGSLFVLLLSGVFFSCTKILHENCSWGTIIRTTVVQSIIPSLLLLASAVATLLSLWLGILLFSLSQIAWIILTVMGLGTLSTRSWSGRFWFPLITLLFAALLIFNFIVYKTGWQLAKNITISYDNESMTISEIMESEGLSEAGDFFEAVLGDLF